MTIIDVLFDERYGTNPVPARPYSNLKTYLNTTARRGHPAGARKEIANLAESEAEKAEGESE
jgi:hypothetical protein